MQVFACAFWWSNRRANLFLMGVGVGGWGGGGDTVPLELMPDQILLIPTPLLPCVLFISD